jgi:FAD/FMN-containing dehydrogenase/Fe-S oxidoreductase
MKIIPTLDKTNVQVVQIDTYISELKAKNFTGDIHSDYASRVSSSIDNSVYAVVPQLVLFPRNTADVNKIFELAGRDEYRDLKFSPRGAGTGTNGQSLCSGVMIDTSRYLNNILEVNIAQEYVRVQPGVVLDQLNESIKDSGYFFAPDLSPSSRATLGGMANTDACGKGSRIYGRTSQHILGLECVLIDGTNLTTKVLKLSDIKENEISDFEKNIYSTVVEQIIEKYDSIEKDLPKLSRLLTGYNLASTYDKKKKSINLSYLISGSEGTLAFVSELKLKLTKKPKYKALFAVSYPDFDMALRAARDLLSYDPSAIETVDANIIALAKNDEVYHKIKHMLEKKKDVQVAAVNFIEFIAQDEHVLNDKTAKLEKFFIEKNNSFHLTEDDSEMSSLWELRKKGVGLLGAMKGDKKPVPFMEDTLVPPEKLADYIKELTVLLDSYGLKYGMFGHVDVGCLHVRPALDMNTKEDMKKIVEITERVNDLVKKYGGLYWSEHGKGYRSEYVKDYFGDDLYQSLEHIKKAFDPYNQLNPGKIAVPHGSGDKLVKVDGPFRGYDDMQVPENMRKQFSGAFNCNGNSQCLNYDVNAVICPSAKTSRNWAYSPKGRSAILREWLKQVSAKGYNTAVGKCTNIGVKNAKDTPNDFSHEVYDSLDKCLGCKACATACPIKVDIPHMKSMFLENYHTKYSRPALDYFVKYSEAILSINTNLPNIFNDIFNSQITKTMMSQFIGFVDAPTIAHINLKKALDKRNMPKFDINDLESMTKDQKAKTVCIVQDVFTTVYDTDIVLSLYDFLFDLGYMVYVVPFRINGKPAHVKGFIKYFKKQATKATNLYNQIASTGVDMIGIDPAMTLVYRDEYTKLLGNDVKFKVKMIQEWLSSKLIDIPKIENSIDKNFTLFAHCTERSLSAVSMIQWQQIFSHFGMKINVAKVGCCGMSGSFGHEAKHLSTSKNIYNLSWRSEINKVDKSLAMATGFSCRSQVKRIEGARLSHPIQILQRNSKKYQNLLT